MIIPYRLQAWRDLLLPQAAAARMEARALHITEQEPYLLAAERNLLNGVVRLKPYTPCLSKLGWTRGPRTASSRPLSDRVFVAPPRP